MRKQLSTLQQLIAVMDPELYRHLGMLDYGSLLALTKSTRIVTEKTDSLNLFFCFRYVVSYTNAQFGTIDST